MPKDYLEASAVALNNEPKTSIFVFTVKEGDSLYSYKVDVQYTYINKQDAIDELMAVEKAAQKAIQRLRNNA